jgi:hypothetical protein
MHPCFCEIEKHGDDVLILRRQRRKACIVIAQCDEFRTVRPRLISFMTSFFLNKILWGRTIVPVDVKHLRGWRARNAKCDYKSRRTKMLSMQRLMSQPFTGSALPLRYESWRASPRLVYTSPSPSRTLYHTIGVIMCALFYLSTAFLQ